MTRILLVSTFAFATFVGHALAADTRANAPAASGSGWLMTVKGNFIASPAYPGSDKLGFIGYPSLSFSRVGEPVAFGTPDDGISIGFNVAPEFRMGPVIRFQGGRYDGDNRELRGIRDVNWAVEPGLFAEFWPIGDRLRTRLEVRHGVGGHQGFVATVGADLVERVGAWTFSAGPRVHLADSESNNTYFGVSARDAALNPFVVPFKAQGGLRSVGAAAAATYQVTPAWATTVYAGYDRLTQDAARSPITRAFGSPDQFKFGASLSYTFEVPKF